MTTVPAPMLNQLELLIDHLGVADTLAAIADICETKAAHCQDQQQAKVAALWVEEANLVRELADIIRG